MKFVEFDAHCLFQIQTAKPSKWKTFAHFFFDKKIFQANMYHLCGTYSSKIFPFYLKTYFPSWESAEKHKNMKFCTLFNYEQEKNAKIRILCLTSAKRQEIIHHLDCCFHLFLTPKLEFIIHSFPPIHRWDENKFQVYNIKHFSRGNKHLLPNQKPNKLQF